VRHHYLRSRYLARRVRTGPLLCVLHFCASRAELFRGPLPRHALRFFWNYDILWSLVVVAGWYCAAPRRGKTARKGGTREAWRLALVAKPLQCAMNHPMQAQLLGEHTAHAQSIVVVATVTTATTTAAAVAGADALQKGRAIDGRLGCCRPRFLAPASFSASSQIWHFPSFFRFW